MSRRSAPACTSGPTRKRCSCASSRAASPRGASASPIPTRSTPTKPTRPPATSSTTSCCRLSSRASPSASWRAGSAASAATAWPRPRSRTPCLILIAVQRGIALHELLGRPAKPIMSGLSIGLQETPDALLRAVERAVAKGYHRVKMKVKKGPGRRLGARRARPLPGRAAHGGRQRRLHAGGRRPPAATRRVQPDDGRAAALLQRHHRARLAAAGDEDRRSASTSPSTASPTPPRPSRSAPAASST